MGLRFWRRVRIIPGLRMNLSRSGVSLSVGRRGMWYTAGPKGQRATLGLPGTGIFWTEHSKRGSSFPNENDGEGGHRLARWLEWPILIVLGVLGLWFLVWLHS
jgi:hypothetical protein